MGAYFVLYPHSKIITLAPLLFIPYFIEIPAFIYMIVWFSIQFFSGAFSLLTPEAGGGIAWWAHIGGFISGIVLLPLFKKGRYEYRSFYRDELYYDIL